MINRINKEGPKPFKIPTCTYCGIAGHSAWRCLKKARKPLSKSGKLAMAYKLLREQFLIDNPGPYYCYYCLYLGVEIPLKQTAVNVEHYHSKARRPDLRFKKENLVVSCSFHNKDKGSLDGDTYLERIKNGRN